MASVTTNRKLTQFVDGFIAFVGAGENRLGRFPANLTELNEAMQEWLARPSCTALGIGGKGRCRETVTCEVCIERVGMSDMWVARCDQHSYGFLASRKRSIAARTAGASLEHAPQEKP